MAFCISTMLKKGLNEFEPDVKCAVLDTLLPLQPGLELLVGGLHYDSFQSSVVNVLEIAQELQKNEVLKNKCNQLFEFFKKFKYDEKIQNFFKNPIEV